MDIETFDTLLDAAHETQPMAAFNDDEWCNARGLVKRSPRRDLRAFLLLDELSQTAEYRTHEGTFGDSDPLPGMVVAAEHDEIYLDIDVEALAHVITESQIEELAACGVNYHDDSLQMFV